MSKCIYTPPKVKHPSAKAMMKGLWFESESETLIVRYLFHDDVFYLITMRSK